MSGYCNCDCPDCFETAISGDDPDELTLCDACQEAGCDGDGECQALDAYGGGTDG